MNPSPPASAALPLDGKVALVTGSSRGIGAAIAMRLAADGADVMLHSDRDRRECERLAQAIRARGRRAGFALVPLEMPYAARDLLRATKAGLGPVDILVSNVAVQIPGPWAETRAADLDLQVAVNFRAAFTLMQLAVPGMIEKRWGRIVTIGSVQEEVPNPDMIVYGALKAAQVHLVRNLARQLASSGITVNNVSPGVIDTDRSRARLADPRRHRRALAMIPAGRIGTPEECAHAVGFLAGDAARYITGITLRVDGGMGA